MKRILLAVTLLFVYCSSNAQVVINEICPANADLNYDPNYFNFSGWVELYNAGSSSVSISGYYLTDDAFNKTKWRVPTGTSIPAKGYRLIWCDDMNTGTHTNFSLDTDGEELVLSNGSLVVVDNITFPKQYLNISYGRTSDGGIDWAYLLAPTPGAMNSNKSGTIQLEKPVFSLAPGRYAGAQQLAMTQSQRDVEIRYTTDGSEPTLQSPLYTSPISIGTTSTVKGIAFREGAIPSKAEVATYFINQHTFTLPVVSISTKPAYLEDNTIGIYTNGTNGIPGNCQSAPMNWNQDWDRHAVFELFNPDGTRRFDQAVDIRIGGACSRNNPQKSFVIKARDKYGKKTLDEKLFPNKPFSEYGGFIFRNAGNDFWQTMFRDAFIQHLTVGQMDIDYLDYQPAIFYLNGDYWGIQNMREKIDGDYIEANYGISKDDIDLVETWGNAIEGTSDAYNIYLDSLQNKVNRTDPQAIKFIERHIDVQEFINYLATEIYVCNTDWPGNNVKFWRQRSTNGKFRWILWDLDFGFALYTNQSYATHPTLSFATDPDNTDWPNPAWSTLHLRLLLQNPVFRSRFIQTLTTAMGTTFSPDRVNQFITTFQNRIAAEMPHHATRWETSVPNWNYEVGRLRDFAEQRNAYMRGHIADFFGLGDQVKINATVSPAEAAVFNFNGVRAETIIDAPYYKGLPFQITPQAQEGFAFKNWKIKKRESASVPLVDAGGAWRYFDLGSLPDAAWMAVAYNDNAWQQGNAQLGYGEGDEETVVSYGPDGNNKFITTYFRKSFSLADTVGLQNINAKVLFDDGVIVYLNGIEVYRNNMPGGAVTFNTLALQAVPVENAFNGFVIPKGILIPGQNVLAVEVHQNGNTSSDISFDFSMSTVKLGSEVELTSTTLALSDTAYTDIELEAVFETQAVNPVQNIVINEFSAASSWVTDEAGDTEDWIELLNTGTQAVDLAGLYITDKLSSKLKFQIKNGVGGETMIAPGEYKVLWADEDVQQGALHLGFKLSADGEELGLYQKIENTVTALDEVTFDANPLNVSYARIPDATGPFMTTTILTPGAANQFEEPLAAEDDLEKLFTVYPNPTTGAVVIQSTLPIDGVKVFDSRGKLVRELVSSDAQVYLSLREHANGLYILSITSGSKKVMKRVVKIQ